MKYFVAAVILFLGLGVFAQADAKAKSSAPEDIPCWKINGYIFLYGQSAAYSWASARYTSDQIQAVRYRCNLKWNG